VPALHRLYITSSREWYTQPQYLFLWIHADCNVFFSLPGFVFVQKIDLNADRNGDEGELPPQSIMPINTVKSRDGAARTDMDTYLCLGVYVFRVPLSYYFNKYNTNYIA
jgi:hypothetical protein